MTTTRRPTRPRRVRKADPFRRELAEQNVRTELATLTGYLRQCSDVVNAENAAWREARRMLEGGAL